MCTIYNLATLEPKPQPIPRRTTPFTALQVSTDKLSIGVRAEGLWPLDRSSQSTVDDELRKDAEGT